MSQSVLSSTKISPSCDKSCPGGLSECALGQAYRVVGINGNRALTKRLMGLGVRIGSEICIVQQRGQDVVITSTGNRIALGGAIARHLQVERLN